MKRLAFLAAAAVISASTLAPLPAQALSDDERAALAAILFLGVAAAAASRHGDSHDSMSDWDEARYGKPFSPSDGIVCLPKPRQCFADGRLSHRWTQRIYG